MANEETKKTEQGDIYFFFRPKVEEEQPESLEDVQRFYMVLNPDQTETFRLTVIGRKELPEISRHEREWGFVDLVAKKPEEVVEELAGEVRETKTKGKQQQPAARPVGEG